MSNYSVLKQDINNNIYENQTQQITGTVLNAILNEMTASLGAGYQFAGVATLGMNPGDPDQRVFYLAGEGIYTNFGGIQVPAGKLGVLKWDNRWTLQTIDGLGGGGANLTGYVSVASTDDLPDEGQPTLGYLCGTNLYLYVGEGGDTKEGKYQDCGSFRGPQGDSVQDVEQTQTSLENGGVNKIKFTLSNGISCEFQVRNGTTSSGLFPTVAALQAAYPNPVVGQYAFVGAGFPADIYVCTTAGTWTDSGEDYDGDNVDLTDYATKAEVNQLEAKVDELDFKAGHAFDRLFSEVIETTKFKTGVSGDVKLQGTGFYGRINILKLQDVAEYTERGLTISVVNGEIHINGTVDNNGAYKPTFLMDVDVEVPYGSPISFATYLSGSISDSIYYYVSEGTTGQALFNVLQSTSQFSDGYRKYDRTTSNSRRNIHTLVIYLEQGLAISNAVIKPLLTFATTEDVPFSYGGQLTSFSGTVELDANNICVQSASDITISQYIPVELGNTGVEIIEQEIPIGNLVSGVPSASDGTIESSDSYVCTNSVICFPKNGATLKFKLPSDLLANMRYGTSGTTINKTKTGILDGDSVAFDDEYLAFRIYFSTGNYTLEEIQGLVSDGSIAVYYDDLNVIECNQDKDSIVKSALWKFHTSPLTDNYLGNLPSFVHISDLHGDAIRLKRCIEYGKYLGVMGIFNSGDICFYRGNQGLNFVKDIRDEYLQDADIVLMDCVGNHEAYSLKTAQTQYEGLMSFDVLKYAPTTPSGVTYPTYYYKDFLPEKIRVIVANQYDDENGNPNTSTGSYTEEQLNFVADALYTCPAGFGVIIVAHSPERSINKIQGHTKFYQEERSSLSIVYIGDNVDVSNRAYPLQELVDAFISKASFSKTYTSPFISGTFDGRTTFTIVKDFTGREDTAEFIAFVNGHAHLDTIGYYYGVTNTQLVLNITCGNSLSGQDYSALANYSDLARGGLGKTQDAFNVYSIDRENGVVNIVRIGADCGYGFIKRDFDTVPYK